MVVHGSPKPVAWVRFLPRLQNKDRSERPVFILLGRRGIEQGMVRGGAPYMWWKGWENLKFSQETACRQTGVKTRREIPPGA